jgi:transposase
LIRGKSRFAGKYRDLIANGKPPKVALIAVARKIITTANAILKTQKAYM